MDKFLLLCILDSRKNRPTVFSVQCIKRASNTVCSRCVTFCPRMLLLCLRCTRCTVPEYWCTIDAHGVLHQNARDTMYQKKFHQKTLHQSACVCWQCSRCSAAPECPWHWRRSLVWLYLWRGHARPPSNLSYTLFVSFYPCLCTSLAFQPYF